MTAEATREHKETYAFALSERSRRRRENRLKHYVPYPYQREFHKKGATHSQRLLMAANRTGKTLGGGGEMAFHLTGEYPDWWEGRRFDHPVKTWAASDTNETTRDIVQFKLFGDPHDPSAFGTGTVPKHLIKSVTKKPHTKDAISTALIKHKSGGYSTIMFKTYDQGREKWQGVGLDVVWLDEEPPEDIYTEAVTRTLDKKGITFLTFTPLKGLSDVVLRFIQPDGEATAQSVTTATWDDAPHLDKATRDELWATLPPHERDARSKGIPALGSGRIYPVREESIVIDDKDFEVPPYWPRAYGMDVGWNCTASIWGAWNRQSDTIYLYSEYKAGQAEPPIHASAIKARGDWIPGTIDPSANGRSQIDGQKLLRLYTNEGLTLYKGDNAVEAGIYDVWTRLSTGRLKVLKSLHEWLKEFRLYRRDLNGKVVKKDDHLMDATRYLISKIITIARMLADVEEMSPADLIPDGKDPQTGY